ncbi:MAG: M56 family metallopeptidase [Prevotella sp.]|jgi:TonB family protein|nr:M56 family metallopeptidase [Prevotella sp.]
MDNTILAYLIKASVALALFHVLYMLCLKKDTFLKLRRIYFLFALFFSLLFPVITIEIPATDDAPVQIPFYWLPDMEATGWEDAEASQRTETSMQTIALALFSVVSAFYAVKFIVRLFSLVKLRAVNGSERLSTHRIVKVKDRRISPFSFFNWIFIDPEAHSPKELAEIIAHEQVHVYQYHSIDVVLSEILCICFWWNPFAWLLRKEMKLNLEYLADKGVLLSGFDSQEYQYILLQVSTKSKGMPFINNFNVSQLKKRIMMMNKKKSSLFTSIKYLLVIPVGAVLLLGNAVQATASFEDFSIAEISIATEGNQAPQKKGDAYRTVEQMPSFPGGETALYKFIYDNLKYPPAAQESGIQGRVILCFVVKSTGKISDVEIIRGVDPEMDREAVRVVQAMPAWTPGKQNGKAVDVYFTLPVVFKLTDGKKASPKSNTKDEKTVGAVGYGSNKSKDKKAFVAVEQMPSFPGGETAMYRFINDNLKYPPAARESEIQGRVTLRFVVKSTGEISDVEIIRSVDSEMDREAVRVVQAMPAWTPGKQNGKAVDVYFTLPVVYKL